MIIANVPKPECGEEIPYIPSDMVSIDRSELEELQSGYRNCNDAIQAAMDLVDGCIEDRNRALSILALVRKSMSHGDRIFAEWESRR